MHIFTSFPERIFLSLLRTAVSGRDGLSETVPDPADWEAVFRLAEQHHVLPMITDAAYKCVPDAVPDELLGKYKASSRRLVMTQAIKTDRFLSLYAFLADRGLSPVVVKGILCRSLYPEPDFRLSADEDLLIEPEAGEEYHRSLLDFGLRLQEKASDPAKDPETGYLSGDRVLYIEVHRSLFPPDSEAYGDYNRFFRDVFDRTESVEINGVTLRALDPTDHLFYLITHALKHFLHGGFGIRQICDIGLFAKANGPRIDWDRFTAQCGEINALTFAASVFGVAEEYLGIESELPPSLTADRTDCGALLRDVLDSGVFGSSTMSRKHSSTITLGAVEKAGRRSAPKKLPLRRVMFPSTEAMARRYPYIKKYPYLLPAAWAQRLIRYVREREPGDNTPAEALRIGRERLKLLERYGLTQRRTAERSAEKVVDTGEYISSLLELIEQGEEVGLPVAGSSMTPFLGDGRDQVFLRKPERPLRRGDVVLYRRSSGDYVLHRIHRVHGAGDELLYDMVGDAQDWIEHDIRREQVFAVVTRARRKGEIIEPGSFYWWFFQNVWIGMVPLHSPVLRLYNGIRRRNISKK